MVYKLIFIINLDYVQSIKLLGDGLLSVGRTSCLFNCLYIIFWSLRDDLLSLGCTCPKIQGFNDGVKQEGSSIIVP